MNKVFAHIKNNYILLSLFFIVVLGALLRFKGLTFNDYWLDELYSADFSDPSRSFESMLKITLEDVHPPVYQTLLWLWYKVFGFTEYAGRSLSATIGTLGIITIYFLGKELFNKRVGLYATLFISTNVFLIQYSQEVRSYELFFLLTMLSYVYLHRVIHNPNKINILLYWVTTILLFYTHYFSFFIVTAQLIAIVVYIIKYAENKKQLFILSLWTAGAFIISLLPLVPYILETARGSGLGWLKGVNYYFIPSYVLTYFGRSIILVLSIFLGMAISLRHLLTGKLSLKEKYSLILLLIWILVGYLLPYLKGILFSPILMIRLTIVIIPPIILVASYGLWRLGGWKGYLVLSIYFIFSLKILFFNYYDQVTKDQYREVLQEVVKYKSVPLYERIPYNGHHGNITNHYQIYAKMLKLNIIIQNDINLTKDLEDENLPECFWALNAHYSSNARKPNYKIDKSDIVKNPSIRVVHKINYRRAEGVLLSYQVEPDVCAKKVGLLSVE